LIKKLEKVAVRESPFMISDNLGIQEYYLSNFGAESFFIPYGADAVEMFNDEYLRPYSVEKLGYFILIARLEPENNIEIILDGHRSSSIRKSFIVVGNYKTSYGEYLRRKYANDPIQFVGGVYNKRKLDSLRYFSLAYFHGHSVGGTNPSLLEAMACGSFIVAHDNAFNKSVLYESAYYFESAKEVKEIIEKISFLRETHFVTFKEKNLERIKIQYNWDSIIGQHEALFKQLSQKSRLNLIQE